MLAAKEGHVEEINKIKKSIDIDSVIGSRYTALTWFEKEEDLKAISTSGAANANPHKKDGYNKTPLMCSDDTNHVDARTKLISLLGDMDDV